MGQKTLKLASKIGFHVWFSISFREGALRSYFLFLWLIWKKEDLEKSQWKLSTFLGFLLTSLVIRFYWTDWDLVDSLNSIQSNLSSDGFVLYIKLNSVNDPSARFDGEVLILLIACYVTFITFFYIPTQQFIRQYGIHCIDK
jgi:hypothetical protein